MASYIGDDWIGEEEDVNYKPRRPRYYRRDGVMMSDNIPKVMGCFFVITGIVIVIAGVLGLINAFVGSSNGELGDRAKATIEKSGEPKARVLYDKINPNQKNKLPEGAVHVNKWCAICGNTIDGAAYTTHNGGIECSLVTNDNDVKRYEVYCSEDCCPD